MSTWRDVPLSDLVRFRNGKSTKGIAEGNLPVYGSNGIIGTADQSMYDNAIILGRVGAYCGSVAYSPGPFWATDNAIVVEPLKGVLDVGFAYHMLLHADLNRYAGGSAQPLLTQTNLKGIVFQVPTLEIQRRIASILGAYDDLIEVNRRRIAVLEEIARELFQGLVTIPLGALPSATGDNDKVSMPAGWQVVPLGDVANLIMGQSPPSELLNKDGSGLPFHQGVTDFGDLFLGKRVFCNPPNRKKVAIAGDILFSVRAPVGRINWTTEDVVLGRGVCSIRSNIGTSCFLLAHLRATFHETDLIGNGAIYKAVGREDIERIEIALPPLAIREQLERQLSPLYALHWNIEQSNRNLAAARDVLLPRLISGQLSVAQAERELEAA